MSYKSYLLCLISNILGQFLSLKVHYLYWQKTLVKSDYGIIRVACFTPVMSKQQRKSVNSLSLLGISVLSVVALIWSVGLLGGGLWWLIQLSGIQSTQVKCHWWYLWSQYSPMLPGATGNLCRQGKLSRAAAKRRKANRPVDWASVFWTACLATIGNWSIHPDRHPSGLCPR